MRAIDINAAITYGENNILPHAKVQGGDYLALVRARLACLRSWLDLDGRISSAVEYLSERKNEYYKREAAGDDVTFDLEQIKKTQEELRVMRVEASDYWFANQDEPGALAKFDARRHKIDTAMLWRLSRWLGVE